MNRCLTVIAVLLILTGCAEMVTSTLQVTSDTALVANLRSLHTIQTQFMLKNQHFGTFEELRKAGMIDEAFAAGKKHNYLITLVSADEKGYVVKADPAPENKLCTRHFYLDQTGIVRAAEKRPAGPTDPPAVM
jgi:competence protein ComGC